MARIDNLNNFLTDVAESIRTKKGTTDLISPSNFDTEIAGIETGGSTPEKGIIINEYDSDGYPTDIEIVGLTEIPSYYIGTLLESTKTFLNKSLKRVKMCDVTKINNGAFRYSNYLEIINLNDNITSIGESCFQGCNKLILTELPKNLTIIDSYVFQNCSNLNITEIPSKVNLIKGWAFENCTNLTSIDFKNTEQMTFYNKVFNGCTNLTKIILRSTTPPSIQSGTFVTSPIGSGTGYIYVPDESVETYKAASGWSTYANQIKGISELESA